MTLSQINNLLNSNSDAIPSGLMGQAQRLQQERFNNALVDSLVGTLNAADVAIQNNISTYRQYRKVMETCRKNIHKIARAKEYAEVTGILWPLFAATGHTMEMCNIIRKCGWSPPDITDPLWNVPNDWVNPNENKSE